MRWGMWYIVSFILLFFYVLAKAGIAILKKGYMKMFVSIL